MKTFRKHLKKELRDPKFEKAYNEEKELLEIAMRINKARNDMGLTQQELARKAHITQQQLSKVETGINCNMSTFLKVCNALGMKIDIEEIGA